jgi:hypothetical protein
MAHQPVLTSLIRDCSKNNYPRQDQNTIPNKVVKIVLNLISSTNSIPPKSTTTVFAPFFRVPLFFKKKTRPPPTLLAYYQVVNKVIIKALVLNLFSRR